MRTDRSRFVDPTQTVKVRPRDVCLHPSEALGHVGLHLVSGQPCRRPHSAALQVQGEQGRCLCGEQRNLFLILEVEAEPGEFALYLVQETGERRMISESEFPLLVRVR